MLYQPILTRAELDAIRRGNFDSIRCRFTSAQQHRSQLSEKPRSERICIDRLEMILRLIGDNLERVSILDVGCGGGFFCNYLAYLGCKRVVGIDNSIHTYTARNTNCNLIATAKTVAREIGVSPTYIDADFIKLVSDPIDRERYSADVVLFMSVFHHLFDGYMQSPFRAMGDAATLVLSQVSSLARSVMIFEMAENRLSDWSRNTIPSLLIKYGGFESVELIGESDAFEASCRGVYACFRGNGRVVYGHP